MLMLRYDADMRVSCRHAIIDFAIILLIRDGTTTTRCYADVDAFAAFDASYAMLIR